ncbi:type II toxin-antitoxin system RelE family toxin [Halodesulfovibrio aestuarii]|uniref:Type II toxin-antitoxin system RelE/ParE family toxin n=1 Tax=Halodesulfovibrio aestuarii TaxID=126333 RepID=A0ABV4JMX4_9BACT
MSYDLEFNKQALKEWKKLGSTVQEQFKKKLKERLETPKVLSAKLSGADSLYKIKLRQSGYRLVYQVIDDRIVVIVLSVGKRERLEAYQKAMGRIEKD